MRPVLPDARIGRGSRFAFVFAILLALDFTIAGGTMALELLATEAGYEAPAYIESDLPLPWELAAIILFAPVIEEAIFRGPLAGTRAWLGFGLQMLIVIGLMGTTTIFIDALPDGVTAVATLVALGVLLYAAIRVRRRHATETEVPAWFRANVHWFVWGSTLLFGAVHLWNFDGVSRPLDLLIILSQTIGGLILAYTRVHLGLSAAIAQHAIFNGVFAGLALAIDGSV